MTHFTQFRQYALPILLFVLFLTISLSAQSGANKYTIGDIITLESQVLNESREIFIYLPPGYDLSENRYPVFYLLDGQGHFHHATGLVQFFSRLHKIPQMIVVAITNTDRNLDFTPVKDPTRQSGGGADKFLEFLQTELLPYVDSHYRTEPYRLLFGHSLTAFFAVYTLFNQPDLFNAYIAASPWFIFNNGYFLQHADAYLKNNPELNKFLFMTIGDEPQLQPFMDEFLSKLKTQTPAGLKWYYNKMEKDDHGSLTHLTIYNALEILYQDWRIPDAIIDGGIDAIQAHYQNLSRQFGYEIKAPENVINVLGYRLLRQNRLDEAIEIFKMNVELYPISANVYDSLGEGYEANNQLNLAKKYYKIAYERGKELSDPNVQLYKQHLDDIDNKLNP